MHSSEWQLGQRRDQAPFSGGRRQPLTRHVHVLVVQARRRCRVLLLLLLLCLVLDHVVHSEPVNALLLLAVGLARGRGRIVGGAVRTGGLTAALQLGARLGGLLLDLLVGLGLGDGVVEELQVVLGDDGGGWEVVSMVATFSGVTRERVYSPYIGPCTVRSSWVSGRAWPCYGLVLRDTE